MEPHRTMGNASCRRSHDAFKTSYDNSSTHLDNVSSSAAKETQEGIISYAITQFTRQHRTFMFSLLICGSHACFIRWDRAGAIVTKHFDYHQQPRFLAEFLWRFGQLSPMQRGHDPTACLASAEEREQLKTAVMTHISDPTKRKAPKMEDTLDSNYPCYKMHDGS